MSTTWCLPAVLAKCHSPQYFCFQSLLIKKCILGCQGMYSPKCVKNVDSRSIWMNSHSQGSPSSSHSPLRKSVVELWDSSIALNLRTHSSWKSKNTGVGSLSLLQGIFPNQELKWGLLYSRWILYQLIYQGIPSWTHIPLSNESMKTGGSGHFCSK